MKCILAFFFILIAGCRPSESHIKREVEEILGFEGFLKKDELVFKYAKAHSSNLYFSVYQISKSGFATLKEYLMNERGFGKFELSENGFDVHHSFPEEKVWRYKTEYVEKKIDLNQQRYSVFYLVDSETLIIECFSSR